MGREGLDSSELPRSLFCRMKGLGWYRTSACEQIGGWDTGIVSELWDLRQPNKASEMTMGAVLLGGSSSSSEDPSRSVTTMPV